MMKMYAVLMRQGIAPVQIDETDLEDLFVMLDDGESTVHSDRYIDTIMGM